MHDGVEVLVANRGKVSEVNATVFRCRVFLPAINVNVVTALGQPDRQLLGEGFEAPVASRYAARAGDGKSERFW